MTDIECGLKESSTASVYLGEEIKFKAQALQSMRNQVLQMDITNHDRELGVG